jgi:hypothetical protein
MQPFVLSSTLKGEQQKANCGSSAYLCDIVIEVLSVHFFRERYVEELEAETEELRYADIPHLILATLKLSNPYSTSKRQIQYRRRSNIFSSASAPSVH